MAATSLIKILNDNGIRGDGLVRNFCSQDPPNKKAICDAVDTAIALREAEIEFFEKFKDMVVEGLQ